MGQKSSAQAHTKIGEASAPRARTHGAAGAAPNSFFALHRIIGNQAMARLFEHGGIQAKLRVSQPGDAQEIEADRVAEQVVSAASPSALQRKCVCAGEESCHECKPEKAEQPVRIDRATASAGRFGDEAPQDLTHDLGPGRPLEPILRESMESRFGHDFGNVRLHTDPRGEDAANTVNARAFTFGRHVVFGGGEYQPHTKQGKKLLAHELVHVVQQSKAPHRVVQRQAEEPGKQSGGGGTRLARAPVPKPFRFWVKVQREMNPDELLHEFVRQYYRESDEKEIQKKLTVWHWQHLPGRSATKDDAAKKGLFLMVTEYSELQIASMSKEQQRALNEETDKRFWEATGYKPGEKLGSSPEDKEMAQKWLGVRTDILIENEQSRAINALPDDIKAILFAGDRKITPDEYNAVLRLAAKLNKLTPAERKDYLSKVNVGTNSWEDMDSSIDRYILQRKVREAEEEKTEEAAATLFGLEELYTLYRAKQAAWKSSSAAMSRGGYSPQLLQQAQEADRKFMTALQQHKFSSETEFTDALEAYRLRFRAEAVNLAMEVLARYDHMLYLERVKFQNPANAAALVQGIGATKASEHYAAANEKFSEARAWRMTIDPEDVSDALQTGLKAAEIGEEGRKLRSQAEGEVVEGSGKDPLVDPEVAGLGTDREKLAGLDAAAAQQYMLQVIQERQEDTNKARAEFTDDPERIFSLPDLVGATRQTQGIGDNTIYAWIVRDYIADQRGAHLFSAIVLGILALVLAALVPGGGWIAAAALIANAGLSTYQAYEAIKEYQEKEIDYRLNFIQDEPSLLWVGVAIAAAALDLGVTTTQLFKMSAAGLKELELPLREFAAAGDVETAASRLETLKARIDTVEGLEQEVKNALKARADAEAAFNKALGAASSRLGGSLPGAVDPTPLFEAVYYGIKRGANTITKLRKEAKITELMADAIKLPGASKDELKTVFEEVKKIVQIGERQARRGMDDATVLKYVDRVAAERSGGEGAFESIADEMSAWRKPTEEQLKAESELAKAHEHLASLRKSKEEFEAELRAGPKTADGKPDQERIKEIREELKGLEDEMKFDPDTGKKVPVPGREIAEAERAVSTAELAAEKAQLDPKLVMRRAFNGSKERADVIAGVTADQVGKLKTPAQGLTVDHIISIKQISEMEGFGKLTLKERNYLATLKENLIVMDSSANFSKGERSWSAWKQYSTFYEDSTQAAMVARSGDLRTQIQNWIASKVRGR